MSRCTKCKCVHLKASEPVASFNYDIMITKSMMTNGYRVYSTVYLKYPETLN